jgi:hypothetical protein
MTVSFRLGNSRKQKALLLVTRKQGLWYFLSPSWFTPTTEVRLEDSLNETAATLVLSRGYVKV